MKKRLLSGLLAFCLLFSLTSTAFAYQTEDIYTDVTETEIPSVNLEEEIYRALNGITDVPITEDIRQMVTASVSSKERIDQPVEVYYTVRDLGETQQGRAYALTATAAGWKPEEGVAQTDFKDVNVRVSGTLYWTDGEGSNNTLERITGGWSCYDGSYTAERRVGIAGRSVLLLSVFSYNEYPNSDSFDYTVGKSAHYLGCLIEAKCYAANGKDWQMLKLNLDSSIFS
ncbi:MAG: hypothetical protein HFH82_14205 [Lachnospiraceae bacterium]|nr:hypothetical protein [Lachnospiraceae bacterium]